MEIAGQVAVEVKANIIPFEKGLEDAKQEAQKFDREAKKSFGGIEKAVQAIAASMQKVEKHTASMSAAMRKGLGKGAAAAEEVEKANDQATESVRRLSQSYGHAELAMQRFIDNQTGVTRATQQWGGPLADINAEMDRLRAKFNPIFASSKAYEAELDELNRAHQIGAITTREHAAALDTLNERYKAMAAAANAAEDAMQGMGMSTGMLQMRSRQLSFQLIDMGQALATAPTMGIYALQNLGFQVAQIGQLYMGQGGFTQAIKDSAAQVGAFAARLGPFALAAGVAAAALGGLTHEINQVSDVTVTFGDTALAVWQVIADGVYTTLQPAIAAISPWFAEEYQIIKRETKAAGNQIIGALVGAYNFVTSVWSNLGAAFSGFAKQAVNGLIEEFSNIPLLEIGGKTLLKGPDLSGYKRDLTGAESAAISGAVGSFGDAFSRDYMGEFFNETTSRAVENARDRLAETEEAAKGAGKALKKAAKDSEDPWKKIAEEIEKAKESLGQDFGGIMRSLVDGTMEWKDAIIQAGQALLKYLNQMNVAQGGQGIFGGGFMQGLLGSFLGFANGGVFQGGNVTPFANGGIVNRPTLFPMANGAGLMGEAGPEAIMPLRRGPDGRLGVAATRMHSPANDQPVRIEIVSRFDADGGFDSAVERTARPIARQEGADAAGRVAKAVPSMVDARNEERDVRRIRPRTPY